MPNQILILVDSNEYVRLIRFKRRIFLPNKIAERKRRVLNSHSIKRKLLTIIWIRFGTCKIRRLNQLSNFSRIFDWISRIFDWLALNWNRSHLIDLDVAFYTDLIRQFDSAHVKCDVQKPGLNYNFTEVQVSRVITVQLLWVCFFALSLPRGLPLNSKLVWL